MEIRRKRRVFCVREDWAMCMRGGVEVADRGLTLASGAYGGTCCMKAIDSGENGFAWRRVTFDAYLPADSMIRTYAYASDTRLYADSPDLDLYLAALPPDGAKAGIAEFFTPVGSSEDFYVPLVGRYLWLAFEFIAQDEPPVLTKLCVHMSGDHMMDYLPSVYRTQEEFTKRFLSVFDSEFMDMERAIDDLPTIFDFENADAQMLRYLADWVNVDTYRLGDDEIKRRIRTAVDDFESMYTVEGVKRSVKRLVGREPLIIESADVNPNRPGCVHSELYRKLYGENPFRFFILLGEDAFATREERERFYSRMRELIPANTEFELVLLRRCVQLDWHTYLGVNSHVSDYVPAVIDESTSIHHDTMIGGTEGEGR